MFIGSHFTIGSFLQRRVRKSDHQRFDLHPLHFIYGNIKPDITGRMAKIGHYFESTRHLVDEALEIVYDDSYSNKDRSVSLGVVTHFITDYACTYHARLPYKKRNLFNHFFYETLLHFRLLYDLMNHKTLEEKLATLPKTLLHSHQATIQKCVWDYYSSEVSMKNDVIYALNTTLLIVNDILTVTKEKAAPEFPMMAGTAAT